MPYAPVNGLEMYHEIHGAGHPLVLIHGAFSGIGTSFGKILPELARNHQVVAVELQGHARTADIDRPMSIDHHAEDVVALIRQLGLGRVDLFGYSMGAGVALQVAIAHPELVRKLVLASFTINEEGIQPGLMENIGAMGPEQMVGTPWHDEYMRLAPNPDDFAKLVAKNQRMDMEFSGWSEEAVSGVQAPTMLIFGDSDIARPEHVVEMFRLFGGGVMGDLAGMPRSRLAIVPGTMHSTVPDRGAWLAPMVDEFLKAPIPETA